MASINQVLTLIRSEIRAGGGNPYNLTGDEAISLLYDLSNKHYMVREWLEAASKTDLKRLSKEYDKWRMKRLG
jgi:hypothetical protein